jgi:hypothetical protein
VVDLPKHDAEVLMAEGWASPVSKHSAPGACRRKRPAASFDQGSPPLTHQCSVRNRFSMKMVWCEIVRYPMRS